MGIADRAYRWSSAGAPVDLVATTADARACRSEEALLGILPRGATESRRLFVVEAPRMDTDLNRVIVTISGQSSAASVHHRDFPEIRAEAGSPEEAAGHLVNKLSCALDSALTDWRRGNVDQAIADVRAFMEHK